MKNEDSKNDKTARTARFQIRSKEETEFVSWEQYEKEMKEGTSTGVDFPEYEEAGS